MNLGLLSSTCMRILSCWASCSYEEQARTELEGLCWEELVLSEQCQNRRNMGITGKIGTPRSCFPEATLATSKSQAASSVLSCIHRLEPKFIPSLVIKHTESWRWSQESMDLENQIVLCLNSWVT